MTAPGCRRTQAARWDARLRSPDCSGADRAAFAAWRAMPANAAAFARLESALGLLRRGEAGEAAARGRVRPSRLIVAASLTVLLAGAGLLWQPRGADDFYAAPVAAARPLRLADGSLIEMGPGSALDVRYVRGERRVTLLRGDARFSVRPDPDRPFVVKAGDRRVTALATVFGVTLAGGRVQVNLQRGSARVYCWHGLLPSEMTLRAGQSIDAEIGSDRAKVTRPGIA